MAACTAIAGERLWEGESGNLLGEAVALLRSESTRLRVCGLSRAAAIIRHLLHMLPVRLAQQDNRLSILGLLEARLMRPHVVVLGGLSEGVWLFLLSIGLGFDDRVGLLSK